MLAALILAAGAATAATAVYVPTCKASSLSAWGGPTQGAAGTLLTEFAFVNKGASECSLIGYPKLQMLDAAGRPISTTDRHAFQGFDGIERRVVILAPGERAYFGAAYPDFTGAGQRKCPTAAALVLTAPGASQPVELRGPTAAITPYAGSDVKLRCGLVQMTYVTAKRFQ